MGREEKLAFQLRKRKSRRIPPILVTDMDFENDISLVNDGIKEAEDMLRRVDLSATIYRTKHEYRQDKVHVIQQQPTV